MVVMIDVAVGIVSGIALLEWCVVVLIVLLQLL